LPFPLDYTLLFALSAFFCAVALGMFLGVREPAAVTAPSQLMTMPGLARRFARSLREGNFRRYLVGRVVLTLGAGATAFYAVHFKSPEGGGLADSTVIALGAFLTLPQACASYVLGRVGDRRGHKVGIFVGAVAQASSLAVAFLGRGWPACMLCFALTGVAWSSAWVSHANMLFETCPHDSRVVHVTVGNMVLAPFVLLVPLGTGWVMEHLVGARTGIGLALIPTLAGIAWLAAVVKEPRTVELGAEEAPRERAGG
jgi:MFS family permease